MWVRLSIFAVLKYQSWNISPGVQESNVLIRTALLQNALFFGVSEHLLRVFNLMLEDGHVEEGWKQIIFSMIPITGDLTNPGNWRPLAILKITTHTFLGFVLLLVWMMLSRSSKMCVQSLWNGRSRCGVQALISGKL